MTSIDKIEFCLVGIFIFMQTRSLSLYFILVGEFLFSHLQELIFSFSFFIFSILSVFSVIEVNFSYFVAFNDLSVLLLTANHQGFLLFFFLLSRLFLALRIKRFSSHCRPPFPQVDVFF